MCKIINESNTITNSLFIVVRGVFVLTLLAKCALPCPQTPELTPEPRAPPLYFTVIRVLSTALCTKL